MSRVGPFRRGPLHFKSRTESVYFTTVKIEGAMAGTSFVERYEWTQAVDGETEVGALPCCRSAEFSSQSSVVD